jgi:hypothetical protein
MSVLAFSPAVKMGIMSAVSLGMGGVAVGVGGLWYPANAAADLDSGASLGFGRFSVTKGVQKHHKPQKYVGKNSMSKAFPSPQKNRQKFRCQIFLDFFCFIAFSGLSQRWLGVQKHYKNLFSKNRVEKLVSQRFR